ncbi:hypothetical protein MKX01_019152, partial [Papaver californicum]
MTDFQGSSSSEIDSTTQQDGVRRTNNASQSTSPGLDTEPSRGWRDIFWSGIFTIHLIGLGFVLAVLGINRFQRADRLKIDQYTYKFIENQSHLTETYFPFYVVAGAVGTVLGWIWLLLLGSKAHQMMKVSSHILTTYLVVISIFCFWGGQIFWGIAFAIAASLQFLYTSFYYVVLRKAVKMVWSLPEVLTLTGVFMMVMLLWMVIWSFGAAGVVATSIGDGGGWWLLLVLSVSLFWTGAVLCNTVHVIVSGMVFLVLIHGGREAATMPPKPLVKSLRYAVTTSFGSICYGSLFTAAIRTFDGRYIHYDTLLAMLCDILFHIVETLVRFFNKYAYVQIAVHGKNFNSSARDAWELFQSTGVEASIYGNHLGGSITGTCAGIWTWHKTSDRMFMVGCTAMLMGFIL